MVNTWSTPVNFQAFSRKSKLNPDYIMRYELSIKLSQENLYEMAPISKIRSYTVHDLVTRTSSGSLSNSIIIMENLCWKFQEQEDPEAYKYQKCVDAETSNQSCIEIFSNKRFKVTSVAIM